MSGRTVDADKLTGHLDEVIESIETGDDRYAKLMIPLILAFKDRVNQMADEQEPTLDPVLRSLPTLVYCPNCGAAVEVHK